jgi:F-type H+-transporting ATPase subunit alpha
METKHKNVLDELKKGNFNDDITATIENAAKELSAKYSA